MTSPPASERAEQLARVLSLLDEPARSRRLRSMDPALARRVEALLADAPASVRESAGATVADPDATRIGRPAWAVGRLEPGTRVGPLRVVELLGSGGMGDVHLAEDTRLDRRVALKSIRGTIRDHPEARARFLREARILSSLEHPGICRLYDYIEGENADHLVLELIDGERLDQAAVDLAPRKRLELAASLARILAVAHAAGVVHRDLKPGNVMVTRDGQLKVLDFGLARTDESSRPGAGRSTDRCGTLTIDGAIAGTPLYMAPEQAAGGTVTTASDVFALGLVIHELLTGEPARDPAADLQTMLRTARDGDRQSVRRLPGGAGRLIEDLTRTSPIDRPTAHETACRLEHLLARPRRRMIAAGAAAIVLVLVGGAIKYTVDLARERSIAITERGEAERSITFILEDLKPQLEEVGRLDVLAAAADRVLAYYERRAPEELGERDLLHVARGLQLAGEVQMHQGRFEAARPAFERQRDMLLELVERDPAASDRLFALSQAHYWIGAMAWQLGELDDALAAFDRYHDTAVELTTLDPSRPEWAMEVAYAISNRATIYQALAGRQPDQGGRYRALERTARDASIARKRRIAAEHPTFSPAILGLANDLSFRAGLRWSACDLEGATADAMEGVRLLQDELDRDQGSNDVRHRLCMLLARAGGLARETDDLETARALYARMATESRSLVAVAPDRLDWLGERAGGLLRLGATLIELGRYEQAATFLDAGDEAYASMRQLAPDLEEASRGAAAVELGRSEIALARGRHASALESIDRGLEHIERSSEPLAERTRAWLLLRRGQAIRQSGEDGHPELDAVLGLLDREGADDPEAVIIRTIALDELGRKDDARAALRSIEGCGRIPPDLDHLAGERPPS